MTTALLGEVAGDSTVRMHASRMADAAARMHHLIDQLLEVTRLERQPVELKREPCDVGGVLDSVMSLFEARAVEAGIELQIIAPTGVALADRERLLQILSNLVANALKFTPRGGRIELRAAPVEGQIRFEVTDTGSGIAQEQLPHLFERYWQGRSRQRGSLGLGLYICKQLVTAHGGEIGARSTLGQGSTFWFALEAAPSSGKVAGPATT